jgi:hypothetical protein
MTSEQIVSWIEGKLLAHGLTQKLVPDRKTLENAYRRAARLVPIQRLLKDNDRKKVNVPRDLAQRIEGVLAKEPRRSWDEVVWRLVKAESS